MTWGWTGVRGTWMGAEAARSADELAGLSGVRWVALAYAVQQATAQSTQVPVDDGRVVTDDEIRRAVRDAHDRGWRVCLKPVVDCADGTWRAHIGFFDADVPGEPTWGEWFASYTAYVVHHARIATEEGAEMFCVGCEMVRADAHEAEWRELVRQVRAVYPGLVTYNCDKYQEDRLTWWDAVDVIGASGYYPAGTWDQNLDRIERVVARERKPFVFLEAGCPAREGAAARPNDWTHPGGPSGEEQASYLAQMFRACSSRPWVAGFFLWDWPARLPDRGAAAVDGAYCVYGKPGAEVVDAAYRAMTA
nr:1,4-beta-xylanase [Cellulomonas hominis]